MNVPLVVTFSEDATAAAIRRLSRDGWCVQRGLTLPREPWDVSSRKLVVSGPVPDPQIVPVVISAASRGAGVVVQCLNRDLAKALVGGLRRIGPVRQEIEATAQIESGLTREQSALLARLAAGESIAAAAEAEFLSLRTANRRLSQARALLGAATTTDAVAAYVKLIDAG
ncbi:MAG TPA: hypothetical protein VHU91_07505 [Mycobacteriales bacterium]|jgi:DNA-binding NarL/FixJ family response regulator|nr:hypothetical protein [Mycobacteriales bacterium]